MCGIRYLILSFNIFNIETWQVSQKKLWINYLLTFNIKKKKSKVIILDCTRIFVNEVRVLSFLSPYSVDRCSIETHSATSTINLSLLVFRAKKNGTAKKLVDAIVLF